jgi:hypothetical protein
MYIFDMLECQLTFDWLFLISIMLDHYNNCTSLHIRYTTFSLFLFKPDIENTYITTILEHKVIQQGVWQSDSISMNKSCGKNNLNQSTL